MALIPALRSKESYAFAATNELLFGLLGGLNCLGYEQIVVTSVAVSTLTPPLESVLAIIVCEKDLTTVDDTKIIRIREDEVNPTTTVGMPLGDLTIYEVKGVANLTNFRARAIEAGKNQIMNVTYYG